QMFEHLIGNNKIECPVQPVATNIELRVVNPEIFSKRKLPPRRLRTTRRYFENRKVVTQHGDLIKQCGIHNCSGPLARVISGASLDGPNYPSYEIFWVSE